jgi:protein transport protein SEC23
MSYIPLQPILLDSVSIKHNVILLLNTFFHILIFHEELVVQWQKQGYQDQEEYENFKELLEMPVADAPAEYPFHSVFQERLSPKLAKVF